MDCENGRNNALRINGLGAPKKILITLLRKIKVPNTSYGKIMHSDRKLVADILLVASTIRYILCRRWNGKTPIRLLILIKSMPIMQCGKDKPRTIRNSGKNPRNKERVMNEYVLMIGSEYRRFKKNIEKLSIILKQTFGIVCLSQQLQTKAENMSNKLPYINVAAKITSQSDEIELKQTQKHKESRKNINKKKRCHCN